jgi:WS/DGAT/MGAT family acyltransferase
MHLASILIFEAGELRQPDGGIDADAISGEIASKLHRVPRYRQKIAWIPFARRPVWVDDRGFDLNHHVRHTSLPRPGNDEQLKRLAAHIMEQPLDGDRPLWQVHIVEGMEEGRFALIAKVHHCMVDGVSGIDLLKVLLSPRPGGKSSEPPRFTPRENPGGFELCRDEIRRRITHPMKALRDLGSFLVHAAEAPRSVLSRIVALGNLLQGTLRRPSPTPFNQAISAQRRIDWLTMTLEPIEGIRGSLGGSLNDVVLAVVTGAVQRYLAQRKIRVATLDFRVMTPVSMRTEDQSGTLGNQVSAWIVDLPVSEPDPCEQLRRIHLATRELKESKLPIGAAVLTEMSEWTYSALLVSLTARHVTRLLPCNLVVTNIPGPQFPVYMLSAMMCEALPLVPLTDGLGLNIAVMSYDGKLCWGFNADYDLVPDLDTFVSATKEAFDELCRLTSQVHPPNPRMQLSRVPD